ncbi:MAG: FIG01123273: hypothetical protein, partial [uncultured Corynebacteriales bacterium]
AASYVPASRGGRSRWRGVLRRAVAGGGDRRAGAARARAVRRSRLGGRERDPVARGLPQPGRGPVRPAGGRHLLPLARRPGRRRLLRRRHRLDLRVELGDLRHRRRVRDPLRLGRHGHRGVPDPVRHQPQLRRWPHAVEPVAVLRGGRTRVRLRDEPVRRSRRAPARDGPLQPRGGRGRPGPPGGVPDRGPVRRLPLPVPADHVGRPVDRHPGGLRRRHRDQRHGPLAGRAGSRRLPDVHALPGGRGQAVQRWRGLLLRRRRLLVHHQGRQQGVAAVRRGQPVRARVRRQPGQPRSRPADRRGQHHRDGHRRHLRRRGRREHGGQPHHPGRHRRAVPADRQPVGVGDHRARLHPGRHPALPVLAAGHQRLVLRRHHLRDQRPVPPL